MGPLVVLGGGLVSYERSTLVQPSFAVRLQAQLSLTSQPTPAGNTENPWPDTPGERLFTIREEVVAGKVPLTQVHCNRPS